MSLITPKLIKNDNLLFSVLARDSSPQVGLDTGWVRLALKRKKPVDLLRKLGLDEGLVQQYRQRS